MQSNIWVFVTILKCQFIEFLNISPEANKELILLDHEIIVFTVQSINY